MTAALLDEELAAWRSRPLGGIHYLFLDARYEKLRDGGVVRDAACSPPSASERTGGGACSASPAIPRKPKSNRDALLRLATAILVEVDEEWATSNRIYINWHSLDA